MVNNYRYAGEQWDGDLGLYYNRARYYAPELGRFWSMDSYEGSQGDPLSLHKYLYASANPVNRIDPSGHADFALGSVLSAIGIGDVVQSIKAGRDVSLRKAAKEFGESVRDAFSFEDPNPNERTAVVAERLWAAKLARIGLTPVILSPGVGRHGPDMVAWGYVGGKYRLIIAEIKGMKRSRVLSSLDKLDDGAFQMSAKWIDSGLSKVIGGIVEAGIGMIDQGPLRQRLRDGIEKGELDLCFLRAREGKDSTWTLRGFRLMHVGGSSGVSLTDGSRPILGQDGGLPEIETPESVKSPF